MSTLIISLILIAIVCFIIYGIIKDRKNGKGICGGNCADCSAGCLHKISQDDKNE